MMKNNPCLTCSRVKCPANCENKQCQVWQRWFLHRWAQIHKFHEVYVKGGVHK